MRKEMDKGSNLWCFDTLSSPIYPRAMWRPKCEPEESSRSLALHLEAIVDYIDLTAANVVLMKLVVPALTRP